MGNIKVVIGLKLDYAYTKKATISVWRPDLVRQENGKIKLSAQQTIVERASLTNCIPSRQAKFLTFYQIFRNEDGTPNNERLAGLHLALKDFAPEPLTKQFEENELLFIPSQILCQYLDEADEEVWMRENNGGVVNDDTYDLERDQSSSPPEEIDDPSSPLEELDDTYIPIDSDSD
ncbi:hypothetical protein A1O3_06394 [Capronia epimyces CBS 606.96]|uniref:Uncharacterized protein n=1 Tax=Capronia epimyces CBS 606.96 TaxID=1182542 RepID=W9Y020_9EURO|nr:uncharacterized protein A1O3_06394 [Capronia epimyces CBS 606.96]EXJ82581.1 hypothetical protein A1O3_06394 [Capronia epimyces CBS 606.96]